MPRDAQRGDGARRCAAAAFASGGASAPGLGWTGPLNRKGVCAAAAEEESPPPPLSTDKGGLPKQPGWKQWLQVSYSQALVLPPRSGMHPRSTQHAYTRCVHRSLWSRGLASLWQLRCRGVIRWSCGADNHYFLNRLLLLRLQRLLLQLAGALPFHSLPSSSQHPVILAACTVHMVSAFCTYDLGDSCASDLGDLYI